MEEFLAPLSLLIPAFSLPAPPRLACRGRFTAAGTLPYHSISKMKSTASENGLSPVTLSAHGHLTSELLRTLLMYGCL